MRAKTILTVLFLLSIGVAAAIFMRAMSVQLQAGATGPEALVAAAPLLPGTLLRAEDVAWHPLAPTGYAGAILRPDEAQRKDHPAIDEQTRADVYGAALRVELAAGDPIRSEVIVKPGDRDFLRVVLTPGLRAISIPVKTGGAGAGMLDPGDRVDVILTQRFEDKNGTMVRRSVAETVVEDLRVLAIDAASGKGSVGQNDGFGRTVTLEVTPPQAQKINVASELGKLSLTLRPTDTTIAGAPPASGPAATWAGDVSPALGSMLLPPPKDVVDPSVEVMRGDKAGVKVKPR
jgi:pilus assembly protein CpaB